MRVLESSGDGGVIFWPPAKGMYNFILASNSWLSDPCWNQNVGISDLKQSNLKTPTPFKFGSPSIAPKQIRDCLSTKFTTSVNIQIKPLTEQNISQDWAPLTCPFQLCCTGRRRANKNNTNRRAARPRLPLRKSFRASLFYRCFSYPFGKDWWMSHCLPVDEFAVPEAEPYHYDQIRHIHAARVIIQNSEQCFEFRFEVWCGHVHRKSPYSITEAMEIAAVFSCLCFIRSSMTGRKFVFRIRSRRKWWFELVRDWVGHY